MMMLCEIKINVSVILKFIRRVILIVYWVIYVIISVINIVNFYYIDFILIWDLNIS